jgi:hypothetical protein
MSNTSSAYLLAETLFYTFRGETDLLDISQVERSGIVERLGHMTNVEGIVGWDAENGKNISQRLSLGKTGLYYFSTTFTEPYGKVVKGVISPASDKNLDALQNSIFTTALESASEPTGFTKVVKDELLPRLESMGGRRTDSSWDMRRVVPLSSDTYTALTKIAEQLSGDGGAVSPMQVAAFAIEKMISSPDVPRS